MFTRRRSKRNSIDALLSETRDGVLITGETPLSPSANFSIHLGFIVVSRDRPAGCLDVIEEWNLPDSIKPAVTQPE